MRPIDLTGQVFGRLTVLEEGAAYRTPRGVRRRRWRCRCVCGNETLLEGGKLTHGNTKSCGCLRQHKREANPNYRGDRVTYAGMHSRVRLYRGRAGSQKCMDCGEPAQDWSYRGDCPEERLGKNMHHECPYCPHVECYDPRCRDCHKKFDTREKVA